MFILIGRDYFGRSQHFCLAESGKIRMLVDKPVPGPPSLYVKSLTPCQPSWLLFDKEALVFSAYYQQTLEEMRYGPALIREVKIYFYLEDGTMKVIEPVTINSSLAQGTVVSRQKVPLPKLENCYFDVLHLNIGKEINIFGKVYLIVDCDKFTRSFLNRLGIGVPDPIEVPKLDCLKQFKGIPKVVEHIKSEKQFLEFDKKVLKFQGFWDDRDSEYGKLYHLEIMYFLADDTIEIKQKLGCDESTDIKKIFLRRTPLPKEMRYALMSPDAIHPEPLQNFGPSDLIIGAPINVYGRMVIISDCDEFTKEYYRVKYGLDNFEPVLPPVPFKRPVPPKERRPLPPWNGHGTHDDSSGNCIAITPKSVKVDQLKFFEKDKLGYDSNILRFCARLITNIPEYAHRKFIISLYLYNDSMTVYEKGDRNSPYPGGMFFKRALVLLPGQNLWVPEKPRNYVAADLWLGNILTINHHCFLLIDADEYTLRYMELHPYEFTRGRSEIFRKLKRQDWGGYEAPHKEETDSYEALHKEETDYSISFSCRLNHIDFPQADIKLIMEKIRNFLLSKENIYKDFVAKNMPSPTSEKPHMISKSCMDRALKEIMCDKLCEHEFMTICRYFAEDVEAPKPKRSLIRALVYGELVGKLWQNLDRLTEHLCYLDEYQTGELSEKDMWQALQSIRIPLKHDLMKDMLSVIKRNDNGDYCYADLLDFLNFKLKPPAHFQVPPSKSTKPDRKPKFDDVDAKVESDLCLNWDEFIKYLNLEYTLQENP